MPVPLRGPMIVPDRVVPGSSSGSGVVQFELVHALVPLGIQDWSDLGSSAGVLDGILAELQG